MSTPTSTTIRYNPPKGFREQANFELVCPHRDLSCCPACVAEHPEIVDTSGMCFWIADPDDRATLAAEDADRRRRSARRHAEQVDLRCTVAAEDASAHEHDRDL